MIKKDVIINIKGVQTVEGEDDVTEVDVVGSIYETENGYDIEYYNYGEHTTGRTVISVGNDDTILMTRTGGEFTTEMMFEQDVRHSCEYETPYGFISLGIYTNELKSDISPTGGSVLIDYNLDFNTGFIARNVLDITVNTNE